MTKTRVGDPFLSAHEYGRSLPKFTVNLLVRNVETSLRFYRDVLGFQLTSRDYVARFDVDGVLFELVPNPRNNPLPGTGNARLSLEVADIRRATAALEARGVTTTPVRQEPGGMLSYFQDPDGNELCLWQYTVQG